MGGIYFQGKFFILNILFILNSVQNNPTHFRLHTVGTESIQTPLNFSLFVILQPFAKIICSFFSSMYTQHPILTEKHRIVDIFADLLKKKN